MTSDEIQMMKEARMPKSDGALRSLSDFELRDSFVIGHSTFVIF
jgi:hypothetical protein